MLCKVGIVVLIMFLVYTAVVAMVVLPNLKRHQEVVLHHIVMKIAVDLTKLFVRDQEEEIFLVEGELWVEGEVTILHRTITEERWWTTEDDHLLHPARGRLTKTGIVDHHEEGMLLLEEVFIRNILFSFDFPSFYYFIVVYFAIILFPSLSGRGYVDKGRPPNDRYRDPSAPWDRRGERDYPPRDPAVRDRRARESPPPHPTYRDERPWEENERRETPQRTGNFPGQDRPERRGQYDTNHDSKGRMASRERHSLERGAPEWDYEDEANQAKPIR